MSPITDELLRKYPKIAFYQSLSPDNKTGIEVACIGTLDLGVAIAYLKKFNVASTQANQVFVFENNSCQMPNSILLS